MKLTADMAQRVLTERGSGNARAAQRGWRRRSTPFATRWRKGHASECGAGFKAVRQLKPTFRDALMLALAVYPEARVDVEATGVVLHPSAPAVPRAEAKRIGLG